MEISMYQVDAFADEPYTGNPAAVCLLSEWLPATTMLSIAEENNLAETAFCIEREGYYELRWFTPELEIDLCGHATLATAHILFDELNVDVNPIVFSTQSGELRVFNKNDQYYLDFPTRTPFREALEPVIEKSMGLKPVEILKSRDYFLVYDTEEEIRSIEPDQRLLSTLSDSIGGIIVTAPGDTVDFVSRFFTPGASVFEDPVTGSAHCSLIPYWSKKLDKRKMIAKQISKRGGVLDCELNGERVLIGGKAVTFMKGKIII